jgi:hypothetical protein
MYSQSTGVFFIIELTGQSVEEQRFLQRLNNDSRGTDPADSIPHHRQISLAISSTAQSYGISIKRKQTNNKQINKQTSKQASNKDIIKK